MANSNGNDSTGVSITIDNIINVETELSRVKKLQDSNTCTTQEVLSSIVSSINEAKRELKDGIPTSEALKSLRERLSDAGHREKAGATQKVYHAGLARLSKTIDKVGDPPCFVLVLRVSEVRVCVCSSGRDFALVSEHWW